jgi:hypothetical protein
MRGVIDFFIEGMSHKNEPKLNQHLPHMDTTLIEKITRQLQQEKERVLRERFEKKGLGYLLENIETKRFKRVLVQIHEDCEKWYADIGNDEGELIVTFFYNTPPKEARCPHDRECRIIIEISYK